MSEKTKLRIQIIGATTMIALAALSLIVFDFYANYVTCKEYFPKLNALVCMMSGKTKAIAQ